MNARRGVRIERKAKGELEENGYFVIRSAGSKGALDLIAINQTEILLIQLKTQKKMGRFGPKSLKKEMNILKRIPAPHWPIAKKQLWIWTDRKGWTIKNLEVNHEIDKWNTVSIDIPIERDPDIVSDCRICG